MSLLESSDLGAAAAPRDSLADSLRLALVNGVGPRLRKALLERFHLAGAVLAAAPSVLRGVPGIGPELSKRIVMAREEIDVQAQLDLCREHGIRLLTDDGLSLDALATDSDSTASPNNSPASASPEYPRLLREIPDPPAVLFVDGQLLPQDALAVAIVGSRHATQYGLVQAERLAGSLARAGFTIVSGLARGIDAAAHRGALNAGVARLPCWGAGY